MAASMIRRFATWVDCLHPFMGGKIHAVFYLLKTKWNKSFKGRGRYGVQSFEFSPKDISAIWEVLTEEEYTFLKPFLKNAESPVILDCGGHIGLFSIWARAQNPACRIISLEPSPGTYETIRSNAAANDQGAGNWQVVHGAAWAEDSPVSFKADGDSMGHHVVAGGDITVPGVTLGEMMEKARAAFGAETVDLMKVDIEGAEESFLVAGESFLPAIRRLVIELHPGRCDTDKVRAILSAHYNTIVPCQERLSSKPLLYCYRKNEA